MCVRGQQVLRARERRGETGGTGRDQDKWFLVAPSGPASTPLPCSFQGLPASGLFANRRGTEPQPRGTGCGSLASLTRLSNCLLLCCSTSILSSSSCWSRFLVKSTSRTARSYFSLHSPPAGWGQTAPELLRVHRKGQGRQPEGCRGVSGTIARRSLDKGDRDTYAIFSLGGLQDRGLCHYRSGSTHLFPVPWHRGFEVFV